MKIVLAVCKVLLHLVPRNNRCVYMAHVCSDCVNVCCVVVIVKDSVFEPWSLGALKYVVCLWKGCDGCCVSFLYCEAWSCRCSCMGSVSVPSCICCMFVSCVHPVAVLNVVFCMTCSLLMLVDDALGLQLDQLLVLYSHSTHTQKNIYCQ